MLDKNNFSSSVRLRTSEQFSIVYAGKRVFSGQFYILFYKANTLTGPRLGLVASRRRIRHAVARNRVKRIVREAFRFVQQGLCFVDVIFVARASAKYASKRQLRQCANELLKKLIISAPLS